MSDFVREGSTKQYAAKSALSKKRINRILDFLKACGVPLEGFSSRGLEMMAEVLLATGDIHDGTSWAELKTLDDKRSMTTRGIIEYLNKHYGESISPGSYDDIRRKHLKLPLLAGILVRTSPSSARNDPQRGYAFSPEFGEFVKLLEGDDWRSSLAAFIAERGTLANQLNPPRNLAIVPVTTPDGKSLELSPGEHNVLQKAIVEQFLPRYGYQAELLYLGDTANKMLYISRERLRFLKFFELEHGELPDVVAYSSNKNWIFLIEAVHSSGPISPIRLVELEKLTKECSAPIVYVTAFLDRTAFRKFVADIAWETEVWIAEDPDHLIHFNGDKFLGPYKFK